MDLFEQIERWGFSVSLNESQTNLRIHPFSEVDETKRKWFVENKTQLIEHLKENGSPKTFGDPSDGTFPSFLKSKCKFGDAVAEAINENFISSFVANNVDKKTCGCRDYANKLNSSDVGWCIKNRDQIETKLVDQTNMLMNKSRLIPNVFKRWQAEKIVDCAIEKVTPKRTKFDGKTCVISASDETFLRGLYSLAWTTIYQNDVSFVAYDLGIEDQKIVGELNRWGVKVLPWSNAVSKNVEGWQTFTKPFVIRDAMRNFDRVIWIDADVLVGGDLSPVLEMLDDGLVVPDHGFFDPPNNNNSDCIVDVLGIAKKQWGQTANAFPCCGFMAFNSARDKKFVDSWCDSIQRVESQNAFDCVSYYDQGVFTQIYDGRLVDGRIWNNLRVPRRGSAAGILKYAFDNKAIIHHSGGAMKFWQPWENVRWNNPNFVGSL